MKSAMNYFSICVLFYFSIGLLHGQTKTSPSKTAISARQWVEKTFAKNQIPPFSFMYGEKDSKSFITQWKYNSEHSKSKEPSAEDIIYTYTDRQTGLTVKCLVTIYNDFQAVEWVLKLSNTSGNNSPLIEKTKVIDYVFSSDVKGTFMLHHAKGSNAERTDFQPLNDELQTGKDIYMTPVGGRASNNTAFPFFNIEEPGNQGIMVAVGWSGKWFADIMRVDDRTFSLQSGMEKMQLVLYPGEEIRTPKICLLFWKGDDRMAGHNQFRRFILAHHTRKINGINAELPFASGLGFGGPPPCNEYSCATESYAIAMAYRHQQFNLMPEVLWIDAGWYTGCGTWWEHVGNWTVDKTRFPNGLKPVTDVVHKLGAKFLLWFEPERVYNETEIIKEHPEWVISIPDTTPGIWPKNSLFDLGNPDARLWMTNLISDLIKNEGIDYYRQDLNFGPGPYWEHKDKPQRIGISEIRHTEGLYAYWDSLLTRFPNLIIDNCAGGGRRIDLETVTRSSPLWRSDYPVSEPNGLQNHTYSLNFYLPLHGTGNINTTPYYFRSSMSSAMVIAWDINAASFSGEQAQKNIQDFKRLRPYFYEDYYPLTDYVVMDDQWMAYQLNRPKQDDGIVFAFRRPECQNQSITIRLKGLDQKETYEMFFEDTGFKMKNTGGELMKGIDITIPEKPGSLLISYKKITSGN